MLLKYLKEVIFENRKKTGGISTAYNFVGILTI